MVAARGIKALARERGADICGVAPIERFRDAPPGFNPRDVFAGTRSVLVFGKALPGSVFRAASSIPYSFIDEVALQETLRISLDLAVALERLGVVAVPIPSEPYEYWDAETRTGKGLISLKHAAYFAGLGVIGRNSLLCNREYGNMLKLGALLLDADLEPDPMISRELCSDSCNACIKSCPSGALRPGEPVDQGKCRANSEGATKKGSPITVCHRCRSVCPNRSGWETR